MSSSAKIVPTLGGRFWRLQKEAGQVVGKVVGGSFGSTCQKNSYSQATSVSGSSKSESGSLKKMPAWGSKSSF